MNNELDDWFWQENEWKMKKFEREMEGHYSHVREKKKWVKNKWRKDDGEVINEDEMHGF